MVCRRGWRLSNLVKFLFVFLLTVVLLSVGCGGSKRDEIPKTSNRYSSIRPPHQRFFPKLNLTADRRKKIAAEGPLFVVVLDVDETLLHVKADFSGRSEDDVEAEPGASKLLKSLDEERAKKNSRILAIIILTNGVGSEIKFRNAGMVAEWNSVDEEYDRRYAEVTTGAAMMKDLDLLRETIFGSDPIGRRTVLLLIDDKGNEFCRFNRCVRQSSTTLAVQVQEFSPGDALEGGPKEKVNFSLSEVADTLLTFVERDKVLRSMSPAAATTALMDAFSKASNGQTPPRECPVARQSAGGRHPRLSILMTDAKWMMDYVMENDQTAGPSAPLTSEQKSRADRLFDLLEPLENTFYRLIIRCANDVELEWDTGDEKVYRMECDHFQKALGLGILANFTHNLYNDRLNQWMSFDELPDIYRKLNIPDSDTLLILFDVKPSKAAFIRPDDDYFSDHLLLDVYGAEPDSMWRCNGAFTPLISKNVHQFSLQTSKSPVDVARKFISVLSGVLRSSGGRKGSTDSFRSELRKSPHFTLNHFWPEVDCSQAGETLVMDKYEPPREAEPIEVYRFRQQTQRTKRGKRQSGGNGRAPRSKAPTTGGRPHKHSYRDPKRSSKAAVARRRDRGRSARRRGPARR